ncbi:phage shock protein operon transcriptional activator [Parasalinivibrio latis]|uniref:phage shock protein operon transcriptional activator n=1 Tax=Parasalinivibrio latis TaxID=2952610 RepID=UPI0030E48796
MQKPQSLIGESEPFLAVLDQVSRLAPLNRPVLVIGERGTGKELIAQRIHYLSGRWDGPLVSLNCAAFSEGLIDSELFGHEAGAFTGAKARHQGRFERAENGTLFLDELANAPMSVQEKLLRVIEYGEYERVGGSKTLNTDVRLVCATNEYLPDAVSDGRFRADLLDRLAFDVIHLPPLRARKSDIMALAEHFAIKMCRELDLPYFAGFSENAQQALINYSWPGNVRELRNVVERSVYRQEDHDAPIYQILFDPFDSPWQQSAQQETTALPPPADNGMSLTFPMDMKKLLEDTEVRAIQEALSLSRYHQGKTAEMLGLSYHQLRGLLKKHQLSTEKP